MRKMMMLAAGSAMMMTAPVMAQDAMPMGGTMTPQQVGAGMMMGTPSANYAAWAADSDMYEIQSSKLALSKAKSDQTKDFARQMIADHTTTTKALMAALPNTEPKVPKPPKKLSEPNAARIAALKAASSDEFDSLYMQQQAEAHRAAWSLHKGYSQDGADPALKQVAATAVPIVERHIQHTQSGGAGMKTM
jgi:putative membrane protein